MSQTPTTPIEVHLLGKPGAGKSAVLRALTGRGEVGPGLRPTTRALQVVDLPEGTPVVRLVDRPGLLPADDPVLPPGAAVLAVARLDDPVQVSLAEALRRLRGADRGARVLVVLTGAGRIADAAARGRAGAAIREQLARAAGGPLPWVEVGLDPARPVSGVAALVEALAELLPQAAVRALQGEDAAAEARAFAERRALVLRHAAGAGAVDLLPVVGALGVPAAQAAMLAALARGLGLDWTPRRAAAFASALGGGALVRMGTGFALRQGAKLLPGVGPTLGALAAGAASGALTWALGRAAHAWLWSQARGRTLEPEALRALFAAALAEGVARAGNAGMRAEDGRARDGRAEDGRAAG